MNRAMIAISVLLSFFQFAHAKQIALKVGEPFTTARAKLYADGWRADPLAHAASGDYMGLERQLMQSGYSEVDYCSLGLSFCVLQYTKGKTCLRLQTQGEQIRFMKVDRWSNECRDQGQDDVQNVLPAEVRYAIQWRSDCEHFGRCKGSDRFLLKIKKKYARDPAVTKVLNSDEH